MVAERRALETMPAHRLGEQIGQGGMGLVFAAEHLALGRQVAVKVLRPELCDQDDVVERFIQEARLGASLEHPNILPVYGIGQSAEGTPMVSMKLIEGGSLHDHMQQSRRKPRGAALDELVDVLIQICDALALAHSRGVIHGDIKARNVMLGPHGSVYLVDWGNAQAIGATGPRDAHGRPVPLGTPAVMAPEQASGGVLDERTDVFGVGALLYTLLSRRVPYSRGGNEGRIEAAKLGRRKPLRAIAPRAPLALRAIAERAMQHDPGDRYATVSEVHAALLAYRRHQLPIETRTVAPGEVLIREGDESDHVYLIEEGEFRVTVGPEQRELARPTVGQIIGELGPLTSARRTATVTATTASLVRIIPPQMVADELRRMAPWMQSVIAGLSARMVAQSEE